MTRSQLTSAFIAGLLVGLDNIISLIAFASLIYQGVLSQYIPIVITLLILSFLIIGTNDLIFSKIGYAIAQLQDETAIIYATLAVIIYKSFPSQTPPEAIFITILMTIGFTTFITGLIFYLIGKFELGNIIRYLPYPVICGFLAATGRLIFSATIGFFSGNTPTHSFDSFLYLILMHWFPAFIAAIIVFLLKFKKNPYVLQISFFMIVILFYAALYIMKMSISEAAEKGLMLLNFHENHTKSLFSFDFNLFHFFFSLEALNCMGLIVILSFIALLLNVSSLEFVSGTSIDLNSELKIAGFGNMASGLLGGLVGYVSLASTSLAAEHGKSKITGFVAFIPAIIVLTLGIQSLSFLPKIVIGTYLFYIAIQLIYDWLIKTAKTVSPSEYSIIFLIFATSIFFNIVVAAGLGILISTILFAFNYSKVSPIKQHFSLKNFHSSFVRSPKENEILIQYGDEIQYFKLQGFLFFGSVYNLYKTIQKLSNAHWIILDFELTNNIDSSRIILLANLKRIASENNLLFIFCSMPENIESVMISSTIEKESWLKIFKDKELAFQWCENKLIKEKIDIELKEITIENQLKEIGFSSNLIHIIKEKLEKKHYKKGDVICKEGEEATNILFVHEGRVSVYVGNTMMLTVDCGNILGEIAMYTDKKRSASLIADEDTTLYEIDIQTLEKFSKKSPELITEFHACMARILAHRIVAQNSRLKALENTQV